MAGKGKGEAGGQAAQMAEAPRPLAQIMGIPESAPVADLIGVDQIQYQLKEIGKGILSDELSDIQEIEGVKYRVSKGNEHFSEHTGLLDESSDAAVNGFRLMQRYRRRDQQLSPFLLVMNGAVDAPVCTINAVNGQTFKVGDPFLDMDDPELLSNVAGILQSIRADSEYHAEMDEQAEQSNRERIRKMLVKGVLGGLITATLVWQAPQAYHGIVDRWEEMEAERAAEQAEARQAAREARAEREAEVMEFDMSFDIEGVTAPLAVESLGLATASDQFEGINVPDFARDDISRDLAYDITEGPREVHLEENECTTVEGVPIDEGDFLDVIHDGGDGRLITIETSGTGDTLRVCDSGSFDRGGDNTVSEPAESIFIQQAQSQPR